MSKELFLGETVEKEGNGPLPGAAVDIYGDNGVQASFRSAESFYLCYMSRIGLRRK